MPLPTHFISARPLVTTMRAATMPMPGDAGTRWRRFQAACRARAADGAMRWPVGTLRRNCRHDATAARRFLAGFAAAREEWNFDML